MIAQYELGKINGPRVCVVDLQSKIGGHRRKDKDSARTATSFGAKAILNDLQYGYDFVSVDRISNYDFALLPLMSVMDIEALLTQLPRLRKGSCIVIAGGMGCLNISSIYDCVDIAVFGRAEGQINDILGGCDFPNVWRKHGDPCLRKRYVVRQAGALLGGELGIGCPNKCAYCQYTFVREWFKQDGGYRAADYSIRYEDDWHKLKIKPGRNLSAWDGLSELTRKRVRKPILDSHIVEKLIAARTDSLPGTRSIKIYNIVGYPWETPESVLSDLTECEKMIAEADGIGNRLFLMLGFTPFSPEPLTPMENEPASSVDWRSVLASWRGRSGRERQLYKGKSIEAMILPTTPGPETLRKRVAINRAMVGEAGVLNTCKNNVAATCEYLERRA